MIFNTTTDNVSAGVEQYICALHFLNYSGMEKSCMDCGLLYRTARAVHTHQLRIYLANQECLTYFRSEYTFCGVMTKTQYKAKGSQTGSWQDESYSAHTDYHLWQLLLYKFFSFCWDFSSCLLKRNEWSRKLKYLTKIVALFKMGL